MQLSKAGRSGFRADRRKPGGWKGAARSRALPRDVIEHVTRATGRAAAHAGNADRAEAIDEHARLASFIVQADPAFDEFVGALDHPGADARNRARRAEEKDTRKAHRQLHPGSVIFDGRRARGEGLQRAIEEYGMQRIFARTVRDRFGQGRCPPTARRPPTAHGWAEILRRSAGRDRSCSGRTPRPPPAPIHLPMGFPKPMMRTPTRCARRASSPRRAATRTRLVRSGFGLRTCALPDRRTVRDERPTPDRAG